MDLVDDDGADGSQHLAAAGRGEQQEERFRGRDQNVRRLAQHRRSLRCGRVSSSHRRRHARRSDPLCFRTFTNPAPRLRKIFVNVGAQMP
jgi:hypothetical protein